MLRLSVIIPTRDRAVLLRRTLEFLAPQCLELGEVELIVVDDGSTDATPRVVTQWSDNTDCRVQLLEQQARGPAAARNRGLAAATGEVTLFLGDDLFAAPGMLEAHIDHHEAYPGLEIAVLGRVTWSPELKVTPLMRWLEHGGPQFCYHRIDDPMHVPPTFFWTANLSVKTKFLRSEGGFSEEFPDAAFEDVELGVRLSRKGLELHYEPRALGHHCHPVGFRSSLARMERLAKGALIARKTMPELISLEGDTPLKRLRRKLLLNRMMLFLMRSVYPLAASLPAFRQHYFAFAHDMTYRAALRRALDN